MQVRQATCGARSAADVGSTPLARALQPGHCEAALLVGIVAGSFGSERSSVDTGGRRDRAREASGGVASIASGRYLYGGPWVHRS